MSKYNPCTTCGEWHWTDRPHECPPAWVCHHENYEEEGRTFYGHRPDDAAIKMVQEINDEYEFVGDIITVEVEVDGTKVPYNVSIEPSVNYSITK